MNDNCHVMATVSNWTRQHWWCLPLTTRHRVCCQPEWDTTGVHRVPYPFGGGNYPHFDKMSKSQVCCPLSLSLRQRQGLPSLNMLISPPGLLSINMASCTCTAAKRDTSSAVVLCSPAVFCRSGSVLQPGPPRWTTRQVQLKIICLQFIVYFSE